MKFKILTGLFMGLCMLFTFSTGTFAESNNTQLIEKEKEVDQFLIEKAEELEAKGIIVTHMVPLENSIEIGITPFNEENQKYFYDAFGNKDVKVVEGIQSSTMEMTTTSANSTSNNTDMVEKQKEVDRYVFEEKAKELEEMGITVTHTAPLENKVEIGIKPFNKENQEYFFKAFGEENIEIVEGDQSVIYESGPVTVETASQQGNQKQVEVKSENPTQLIRILSISALLAVIGLVTLKKFRRV